MILNLVNYKSISIQIKHLLKQVKKAHLEEPILETFILVLMVNGRKGRGKNLMG